MKKIERKNFIDVILFAFAIYLLFTTNWSNVDKFSQLLLLMYALCITLRIGNIMKIKQNEMIQRQKQNEQNQNDNTTTENEPKQ
jgi:Mn2+/Fe2+ NRAMP family transporter